ncbi:hypothetical protein [Amycolatopsis sp. NPDC004378]
MITPAQRAKLTECLYTTATLTGAVSLFLARACEQIAETDTGVAEMAEAAGRQAMNLTLRWSHVIAVIESSPRGQ